MILTTNTNIVSDENTSETTIVRFSFPKTVVEPIAMSLWTEYLVSETSNIVGTVTFSVYGETNLLAEVVDWQNDKEEDKTLAEGSLQDVGVNVKISTKTYRHQHHLHIQGLIPNYRD